MLAVLGVALLWSAFSWWRAWSAPLVNVVFRPSFSVEGIASGTPVRVQGVTVGQVTSIGLDADAEGRLRPVVRLSLDPTTLEDRGFADRLRGDRLRLEVAKGLRARLVAVSPASGLLQVELIWDEAAPAAPGPLSADEIPPLDSNLRSKIADFLQQLEAVAEKDLVGLAAELERDLDGTALARCHGAPCSTAVGRCGRMHRLVPRVWHRCPHGIARAYHRGMGKLDGRVVLITGAARGKTLAILQTSLADAGAALASFSAALEGSQSRMNAASAEFSELFRAVSAAARTWTKKAAGLTTEPRPR